MIDGFLRGLRQPEYVHVLLNPLPVYGLLVSWIALIAALISKSRRAHIVTLILIFVTSISAWPVYEFGEQAYDRVQTMTDSDGQAWLDEHKDRAEDLFAATVEREKHKSEILDKTFRQALEKAQKDPGKPKGIFDDE